MRSVKFGYLVLLAIMFGGCSLWKSEPAPVVDEVVLQKVDKDDIRDVMKQEKMLFLDTETDHTFTAIGEGIAPQNTISPAQAIALAKRAAMADAYRQLGAKLYGVKISAKDTVQDAALKDSRIVAQVNGLIKNASIIETSFKDGLYVVTMELKINQEKWQEIFAY